MMVFATYKYVMFHLPWSSSGTGPTTRSSAVEAGKEAVRRSPKHFCCGCDRERTAKYKAKDKNLDKYTNDSVSVFGSSQFTISLQLVPRASSSSGRKARIHHTTSDLKPIRYF